MLRATSAAARDLRRMILAPVDSVEFAAAARGAATRRRRIARAHERAASPTAVVARAEDAEAADEQQRGNQQQRGEEDQAVGDLISDRHIDGDRLLRGIQQHDVVFGIAAADHCVRKVDVLPVRVVGQRAAIGHERFVVLQIVVLALGQEVDQRTVAVLERRFAAHMRHLARHRVRGVDVVQQQEEGRVVLQLVIAHPIDAGLLHAFVVRRRDLLCARQVQRQQQERDSSNSCQKEVSFFCGSKRTNQEQIVCIKCKYKWLGRRTSCSEKQKLRKIAWKRNLPAMVQCLRV